MSKVLFVCNTAYQLLTAAQLRHTRYATDQVDLVLSNQLTGAAQIAQGEGCKQLFNHVQYIENKKQSFRSRLAETMCNLLLIRHLRRILGQYDIVCISNISVFTILFLRFYQFKKFELNIFEDGFITYSKAFADMDLASPIARLINPSGILGHTRHLFVYNPSLVEWHRPNIAITAIDKLDSSDRAFVETLNSLFLYSPGSPTTDVYDKPYLFLEESFYADRFPVNDVEYVEEMAKVVGKENIMIKLHPRNPENRFEKLGYKTNHQYSVPWELILLNMPLNNITLVSISSCAILQPYLIMGQPVRSIALLRMLTQRPGNMQGELGNYMINLFKHFPEVCSCPENNDTFKKLLTNF